MEVVTSPFQCALSSALLMWSRRSPTWTVVQRSSPSTALARWTSSPVERRWMASSTPLSEAMQSFPSRASSTEHPLSICGRMTMVPSTRRAWRPAHAYALRFGATKDIAFDPAFPPQWRAPLRVPRMHLFSKIDFQGYIKTLTEMITYISRSGYRKETVSKRYLNWKIKSFVRVDEDSCSKINTCLLNGKDWSSIKQDRTQSSFTTHSKLVVSRKLLWIFLWESICVTSTSSKDFL